MRIRRTNNLISEAESPSSPKFARVLIAGLLLVGFITFSLLSSDPTLKSSGLHYMKLGAAVFPAALIWVAYQRLQRRLNAVVELVRDLEERLSVRESSGS